MPTGPSAVPSSNQATKQLSCCMPRVIRGGEARLGGILSTGKEEAHTAGAFWNCVRTERNYSSRGLKSRKDSSSLVPVVSFLSNCEEIFNAVDKRC